MRPDRDKAAYAELEKPCTRQGTDAPAHTSPLLLFHHQVPHKLLVSFLLVGANGPTLAALVCKFLQVPRLSDQIRAVVCCFFFSKESEHRESAQTHSCISLTLHPSSIHHEALQSFKSAKPPKETKEDRKEVIQAKNQTFLCSIYTCQTEGD